MSIDDVKDIAIEEYNYDLPDSRIAKYPLAERDASKLLVLRDDTIEESHFSEIGDFLPEKAMLVFNETKVIRARLQFRKETGSVIEIFCLEPEDDYQIAFSSTRPVRWKCLVGNSKRWKDGPLTMPLRIGGDEVNLSVNRVEKNDDSSIVEFSWDSDRHSFADVLNEAGVVPLPPYLHRDAELSDSERYQTVFAHYEGSVAAPTAGLHFTKSLIDKLEKRGICFDEVTLHVGAGTFKPVSSEHIGQHNMHSETIIVRRNFIANHIQHLAGSIVPVGTTSTRTLESLYWFGVMLEENGEAPEEFHLPQWYPYQKHKEISTDKALRNILDYLDANKLDVFQASTSLMIAPSYKMRVINGLITNFHQPKSTLLLLVSALIGEKWKECYRYALDHDFRFLSYGDSCLFMP